jgi:hypothetical protein
LLDDGTEQLGLSVLLLTLGDSVLKDLNSQRLQVFVSGCICNAKAMSVPRLEALVGKSALKSCGFASGALYGAVNNN